MNKPIYSNNRKGPRMRKAAFTTSIVNRELWKSFKESNSDYNNISWEEFYRLWMDIAETIQHETVKNPLGVKLGSYTGELKLQYLPHKFKAQDNNASGIEGTEINHVNLVTNGKVAKIKWERRWAVKFNKMLQFFAFDATRNINKLAKEHAQNNPDKIRVARNTLGGFSAWRKMK